MPAPAPTELLAEELRRLEESNQRLAETVHGLGHDFGSFRAEVAEKFGTLNANLEGFRGRAESDLGSFRAEVAEKFGALNANLEGFRGRAETSLAVARWGVRVLTPLIIGLVGVVVTAAWYGGWNASALNSEVKQLRQDLGSEVKQLRQDLGSEVKQLGQRIDLIDRRLESIRTLLETSRSPTKN